MKACFPLKKSAFLFAATLLWGVFSLAKNLPPVGPKAPSPPANAFRHISLIFKGNEGQVHLVLPNESLFGFKSAKKNLKGASNLAESVHFLETNIDRMVVFREDLKCQWTKQTTSLLAEADDDQPNLPPREIKDFDHFSQLSLKLNVKCAKPVAQTEIVFLFHEFFPHLDRVDVTILSNRVPLLHVAHKDSTTTTIP